LGDEIRITAIPITEEIIATKPRSARLKLRASTTPAAAFPSMFRILKEITITGEANFFMQYLFFDLFLLDHH
jgi:hypothetical protein